MKKIMLHIETGEKRFKETIARYSELQEVMKKNSNLSQTKIGKIIGKSQSYVSLTKRTFNEHENKIRNTNKVNYFIELDNIEDAEYIKLISKMISDTKINVMLPIIDNPDLIKLYNTTYKITCIYREYMLNGINEEKYFNLIPEEIIKQSNLTIDKIRERKKKLPLSFKNAIQQ